MLKKTILNAMLVALIGLHMAWAGIEPSPWSLYDWGFNVNGSMVMNSAIPTGISGLDISGFDRETGLGKLALTIDPGEAGNYFAASFFDLEIDETQNTFFNEQGAVSGIAPTDMTWEIDEPGNLFGDIYDHLYNYNSTKKYDNSVFGGQNNLSDDVSLGMGWNFALSNDEYAVIHFDIAATMPADGFYCTQIDPDSRNNAYFTTSMNIINKGGPQQVPEPTTLWLLAIGCGFLGLFWAKKRT